MQKHNNFKDCNKTLFIYAKNRNINCMLTPQDEVQSASKSIDSTA